MMLTKRQKRKVISPTKIELTQTELTKIITDHCYDTLEYLSLKLRRLQGKKIDILVDVEEEPMTINDWMQKAVSQCINIVETSYDDIGKQIRTKIRNKEI